jgi:hypothetical protein
MRDEIEAVRLHCDSFSAARKVGLEISRMEFKKEKPSGDLEGWHLTWFDPATIRGHFPPPDAPSPINHRGIYGNFSKSAGEVR